jgi:hypothetical protein
MRRLGALSLAQRIGLVLAAGAAARVALAFSTYGVSFDIDSFRLVDDALGEDPLGLYGSVNGDPDRLEQARWPYPPGFLPFIPLAVGAGDLTGLPFHGWIQLPAIAADLAIAVLVQAFLGLRGAAAPTRLAAAALVALGPAFIAVSGYHGQIDSVAILPAVAALYLWERPGIRSRALVCGALIGLGAAVKTVPIVMVLALLPSVRSRREGAVLMAAAIAVPLVALAPFLIADFGSVRESLRYRGAPGVGGLSLLLQPSLSSFWIQGELVDLSPTTTFLYDHASQITLAGVALAAGFLLWRRVPAAPAALVIWVTVLAFAPNFFFQYGIWVLPFLIMAGHMLAAAVVQVLLVVPAVIAYAAPWDAGWLSPAYVALMAALLLAWWALLVTASLAAARPRPGAAAAAPLR